MIIIEVLFAKYSPFHFNGKNRYDEIHVLFGI